MDMQSKREAIARLILNNKDEIAFTRKKLNTLVSERQKLATMMNGASPFLATLPLDVVTQIFSLACTNQKVTGLPTQFKIGRVCRDWRRIAWNTPTLWHDVKIKLTEPLFEMQDKLFAEWTQRAGTCLLSFTIDFRTEDLKSEKSWNTDFWEPPEHWFCKILLVSSGRLRHFRLVKSSINFVHFSRNNDFSYPVLESLDLPKHPSYLRPSPTKFGRWPFSTSPKLTRLFLSGPSQLDVGIDWSLLHEFRCDISTPDHFRVIQGFSKSHIRYISMKAAGCQIPSSFPKDLTFTLPYLKELDIQADYEIISSIVGMLRAPALEKLTISVEENILARIGTHTRPAVNWPNRLSEMAQRSNCKIKVLKLSLNMGAIPLEDKKIVDIFEAMPTVEYLELICSRESWLSNVFVDRLGLQLQSSRHDDKSGGLMTTNGLLPALTMFKYAGPVSCSFDVLYRMLKSRNDFLQQQREAEDSSTSGKIRFPKFYAKITHTNAPWYHQGRTSELYDFYDRLETLTEISAQVVHMVSSFSTAESLSAW